MDQANWGKKMKTRNLSGVIFALTLASVSAFAQTSTNDAQAADAAYQAKNWTVAQSLYQQLAVANPNTLRYWYRLGVASQSAGQHQQAVNAFERAKEHGLPAAVADYNIACAYATMGASGKAMAKLTEAVKQGFSQPEQMTTDLDLQSIRSDAHFAPLLDQAKRNQAPCDYTAENRQFDFWVGQWNVVSTADGVARGASHIERELGNCVIWENWTSQGSGYAGKSYNIYNTNLKRWEQFWVDNAGGMIHFHGGLKDGVMDFWTDEIPQPDGTKLLRHLQFFNLSTDKVRQFSQGSTDGGKTWHVEYDLTYLRKS